MSKPIVEGVKLISHNMGGINNPEDPAYPYRMELVCRVPSFMDFAATMLFGREIVVIAGKTREAIDAIVAANGFKTHPRIQTLTVTSPDGTVVDLRK